MWLQPNSSSTVALQPQHHCHHSPLARCRQNPQQLIFLAMAIGTLSDTAKTGLIDTSTGLTIIIAQPLNPVFSRGKTKSYSTIARRNANLKQFVFRVNHFLDHGLSFTLVSQKRCQSSQGNYNTLRFFSSSPLSMPYYSSTISSDKVIRYESCQNIGR